ncbi:hypothetical protein HK100_012307 [Physocladia obscura]|uniref:Amino acid permease/ SLC12A domain-containing protein n=1 Tax=Physocladia obscura TaxID=109957 RepID=A0AAD5T2I8_9FUNG|nr:hypothetical protein HK100_012307 [Physocladia obscura]
MTEEEMSSRDGEVSSGMIMLDLPSGGGLHRKLKARHLEMIAIGGTIGTGLLIKSGDAIRGAGPLGALITFSLAGLQVYGVVTSLGEMATLIPVEGGFSAFPNRFVSKAFGFVSGWNYWLNWALAFPAGMAGVATLFEFWVPTSTIPSWAVSLIFMFPLFALHLISVRGFAETEFVLSLIKVLTIIIFIIISFFLWLGIGTGTGPLWFTNWNPAVVGDTAMTKFVNVGAAFTTGFYAYGGTELVGLTAGEAENPRLSVPRAIKGTFWRIVIFYVGSIFFVGVLLNPLATWSASPFVYVLESAGISFAAEFINFVAIVAALSASNSSIYACARTLLRLSEDRQAPRIFGKIDKRGVPVNSVIAIMIVGLVGIGASYASGPDGSINVFNFLTGFVSFSTMLAWMIVSITHLRFRAGYIAQGRKLEDLPYIAPFFPWFNYMSIIVGIVVTFFMLISAFDTNGMSQDEFFNLSWWMNNSWIYAGIPITACLYLGYVIFVPGSMRLVSYDEMDFESNTLIETREEKAAADAIALKPTNFAEWKAKMIYKLF